MRRRTASGGVRSSKMKSKRRRKAESICPISLDSHIVGTALPSRRRLVQPLSSPERFCRPKKGYQRSGNTSSISSKSTTVCARRPSMRWQSWYAAKRPVPEMAEPSSDSTLTS